MDIPTLAHQVFGWIQGVFAHILSFLQVRGFIFGIITSLPIGGAAVLVIREIWAGGMYRGLGAVKIPLLFDWFLVSFTLFVLQPQASAFIVHYPKLASSVHVLMDHSNEVLAAILVYLAISVRKKQSRRRSSSWHHHPHMKVLIGTLPNLIAVPTAIMFFFPRIFPDHAPQAYDKFMFYGFLMLGGVSMWLVTFWRVLRARAKRKRYGPGDRSNIYFSNIFFALAAYVAFKPFLYPLIESLARKIFS